MIASFKRSLSAQLALFVVAVTGVVLLSFGGYRYKQQADIMEKSLTDNLTLVSNNLAVSLAEPIFNYATSTKESICAATLKQREIIFLQISENNGEVLTITKDTNGKVVKEFGFADEQSGTGSDRTAVYKQGQSRFSTSVPILYKGQELGALRVSMTDSYMLDALNSTLKSIIAQVMVLQVILALSLIAILRARFIIPIQHLSSSSALISKGDLGEHIQLSGDDELGELGRHFSKMRDSIKEKISDLEGEISVREKAEIDIRRLQNNLSDIIDFMPSILIGVDSCGVVTHWNLLAGQTYNIDKNDAIGHSLDELLPEFNERMNAILGSMRNTILYQDEKVTRKIDDKTNYFNIVVYPLGTAYNAGGVIRIDDVTERVMIDRMMVQAEKMQSVGGLAAGMAHEINNPLGAITQGLQNILRRISPDLKGNVAAAEEIGIDLNAMNEYLEKRQVITFLNGGREAVDRAAKIVSNMLMFSRASNSTLQPADMGQLLENTIELGGTDYDMKKKYDFKFIDIVRDFEPELPQVMCCPTEVEQVLLNILKNGVQAMEDVQVVGFEPRFHLRLNKESDYLRIEVEDNGPGIPASVQNRIFEPFFTTKPVGVGTGLGLSVSYMIITQNHCGTMEVQSEVGVGTKFIIRIPLEMPSV